MKNMGNNLSGLSNLCLYVIILFQSNHYPGNGCHITLCKKKSHISLKYEKKKRSHIFKAFMDDVRFEKVVEIIKDFLLEI